MEVGRLGFHLVLFILNRFFFFFLSCAGKPQLIEFIKANFSVGFANIVSALLYNKAGLEVVLGVFSWCQLFV